MELEDFCSQYYETHFSDPSVTNQFYDNLLAKLPNLKKPSFKNLSISFLTSLKSASFSPKISQFIAKYVKPNAEFINNIESLKISEPQLEDNISILSNISAFNDVYQLLEFMSDFIPLHFISDVIYHRCNTFEEKCMTAIALSIKIVSDLCDKYSIYNKQDIEKTTISKSISIDSGVSVSSPSKVIRQTEEIEVKMTSYYSDFIYNDVDLTSFQNNYNIQVYTPNTFVSSATILANIIRDFCNRNDYEPVEIELTNEYDNYPVERINNTITIAHPIINRMFDVTEPINFKVNALHDLKPQIESTLQITSIKYSALSDTIAKILFSFLQHKLHPIEIIKISYNFFHIHQNKNQTFNLNGQMYFIDNFIHTYFTPLKAIVHLIDVTNISPSQRQIENLPLTNNIRLKPLGQIHDQMRASCFICVSNVERSLTKSKQDVNKVMSAFSDNGDTHLTYMSRTGMRMEIPEVKIYSREIVFGCINGYQGQIDLVSVNIGDSRTTGQSFQAVVISGSFIDVIFKFHATNHVLVVPPNLCYDLPDSLRTHFVILELNRLDHDLPEFLFKIIPNLDNINLRVLLSDNALLMLTNHHKVNFQFRKLVAKIKAENLLFDNFANVTNYNTAVHTFHTSRKEDWKLVSEGTHCGQGVLSKCRDFRSSDKRFFNIADQEQSIDRVCSRIKHFENHLCSFKSKSYGPFSIQTSAYCKSCYSKYDSKLWVYVCCKA
ncbi:P6 [Diaphorina citri reovirus]|nr:P6 [Diaphorina citri reovirus]